MSITFSGGGAGTVGNPYEITTEAQLKEIANDLTAHYILTDNITLNADRTPIGDDTDSFTGSLDGDNFTISGLTIVATSHNTGLFGYIGSGGTVKNLTLNNVAISSTWNYVGGIAGYNGGTIDHCSIISGTITGNIKWAVLNGKVFYCCK